MKKLMLLCSMIMIISCTKTANNEDIDGIYKGKTANGDEMTLTVEYIAGDFFITDVFTYLPYTANNSSTAATPFFTSDVNGLVPVNNNLFILLLNENHAEAGKIEGRVYPNEHLLTGNMIITQTDIVTGVPVKASIPFSLQKIN